MHLHNTCINISRNHEFLYTYRGYTVNYLSDKMAKLVERLAEMFPTQHYQSELDRYISNRHPQNAADVEHFTKEFEYKYSQGKFL